MIGIRTEGSNVGIDCAYGVPRLEHGNEFRDARGKRPVGADGDAGAVAGDQHIVIKRGRGQPNQARRHGHVHRTAADIKGWSCAAIIDGGAKQEPGGSGQAFRVHRSGDGGARQAQIGRAARGDRCRPEQKIVRGELSRREGEDAHLVHEAGVQLGTGALRSRGQAEVSIGEVGYDIAGGGGDSIHIECGDAAVAHHRHMRPDIGSGGGRAKYDLASKQNLVDGIDDDDPPPTGGRIAIVNEDLHTG